MIARNNAYIDCLIYNVCFYFWKGKDEEQNNAEQIKWTSR